MRSGPADLQKCLRTRSHFLFRLRRPRRKCELADDLEESRSTIDRAVRELEGAGFVERTDGGYRTTLAGELALAEYRRYTARLDGLAEARPALGSLPADASLDGALFEDAVVSLPTKCSPHEPIEALEALIADARHVRVFSSAIIPAYVDIYYDEIVEAGTTAEVVVSEDVLEWLLARCEDRLATIARSEGVTMAETTEFRPFSLVITESGSSDAPTDAASDASTGSGAAGPSDGTPDRSTRRVGAMLYDEGQFVGFVSTDTRAAVAWGEATFDGIAAAARPLGIAGE